LTAGLIISPKTQKIIFFYEDMESSQASGASSEVYLRFELSLDRNIESLVENLAESLLLTSLLTKVRAFTEAQKGLTATCIEQELRNIE